MLASLELASLAGDVAADDESEAPLDASLDAAELEASDDPLDDALVASDEAGDVDESSPLEMIVISTYVTLQMITLISKLNENDLMHCDEDSLLITVQLVDVIEIEMDSSC